MDQTLVRSGFDVEIALGSRYLQYLLLLAVETGTIPAETTFGNPPVQVRVHVPDTLDRTYLPDPDPDTVHGEPYPGEEPFAVEILHGHASGADLRVNLLVHVTQASTGLNATNMEIGLFVRLTPKTAPDPDGAGLASLMLGVDLVDVDGLLVELAAERGVTKQEILAALRAVVNRVLDLGDVGSGGRLEDIALRKHPADGQTPAALGIYLNLRLKVGPQPDRFLGPRGDVALAHNILDPESDITFATRPDLPGYFAQDAFFRRAEPSGSGYTYPIRSKGERIGKVIGITAEATAEPHPNKLRIVIEGEYELNNLPNPGFRLVVELWGGFDDDGVMSWHSGAELHSGLLVDLVLGLIAAALAPLIGPWSLAVFTALEVGKEIAEAAISEALVEEKVDQRVDASLLDVAPNRLTVLRRRWDPFYATHHQIGLRPGGTLITPDGIALWGRAVLTREPRLVPGVIIRDSQRDADGTPTHLRYRVQDIDPFRDQLDQRAPGADRAAFTPTDDPYLFQIEVDGAIDRIGRDRLLGAHPYLVKRVEMNPSANAITKLLVISERESNEQRGRLLAEHRAAATAQITQDHQAEIRAAVIAEFTALGVIPTPEQIDTEVTARLQDLIAADVADYADGLLAADLEAALLPLLRLELSPTWFGRLQRQGILTLKDYVWVHIVEDDRYYYRDRFVRAEEPTPAKQAADNLRNRPRYRSTPQGPIFT